MCVCVCPAGFQIKRGENMKQYFVLSDWTPAWNSCCQLWFLRNCFLPLSMSFPVIKKMVVKARGGDWVVAKINAKLNIGGQPRSQRPGVGARRPVGEGWESSVSRDRGSVSPLRLCTRWVRVSSHCGQRKWLPKTAGRLPVVCRSKASGESRGAD